jgi:hypothetical protein
MSMSASRVEYPSFQSAFATVCVTSEPAKGVSASQYLGKASHQSVSRQLSSVSRLCASSSVAFVKGRPGLASPKDTLSRVFKKQRQAVSSSVFQFMRQRFAPPLKSELPSALFCVTEWWRSVGVFKCSQIPP